MDTVAQQHESGLKRSFQTTHSKEKIQSLIEQKLNELKKTISIDGFRAGKVDKSFIMKKYGNAIRSEIIENLINEAIKERIKDHHDEAIQQSFKIDFTRDGVNQDLEFTCSYEVFPKLRLIDFKDINFKKVDFDLHAEEIAKIVKNLSYKHGTFEPREEAQDNSRVICELVLKRDDSQDTEPVRYENFEAFLIPHASKKDFMDAVIGMKVGDTKSVRLNMPKLLKTDDDVAADVTITIKSVDHVTPIAEDKLIQTLSSVNNTLENGQSEDNSEIIDTTPSEDKLKNLVESYARKILSQKVFLANKEKLLDALDRAYDFEIPSSLYKDYQYPSDEEKELSIKGLKIGLIVDFLMKTFSIEINQQAYLESFKELIMTEPAIYSYLQKDSTSLQQYVVHQTKINSAVKYLLDNFLNDAAIELISVEDNI